MDEDLDDLFNVTKQEPTRLSRFAPKGSKLQPKPSSASASLPLRAPKKESADEIKPEHSIIAPKKESPDEIKPDHDKIESVDMDVEINSGVEKVELPVDSMEIDGPNIEDEVVLELDVYFNPSIDPETLLYQFQYPLRPQWRPYDLDDRCEEVRVKPTSAEVEIDMTVDVNSKNYDSRADPALHMKKEILATSWKPPRTNCCTLAVRDGNKVHLNLVNSVVQLRPSMRHLDQKDSIKKTHLDEKDTIKKTAGRNSAQDKKPEQIKDSEEVWVPLKYHSVSSALVTEYLEKLTKGAGPQISFSMSTHEYVKSLCPGNGDILSSKTPSRRSLLALPLKKRFEKWLHEGPPLHKFRALKSLAPDDSVEDVLTVLQELAVLVQGLWVLKTSLFYEEQGGLRPFARNYVLLLFTKDIIIKESKIPSNINLAREMKAVLHEVARHRPIFKDWKLKEAPDLDFIKLNPTVVMNQQKEWEKIENGINNMLSSMRGRSGPGTKTLKTSTPGKLVASKDPKLVASKDPDKLSGTTSNGSVLRNDTSEVREAIRKALQKFFKSTKACSFQQISQRLRDTAVSENARTKGSTNVDLVAANSIDEFPDEFQTILKGVAVNIHGIYVPKSSPDHPEYDGLRDVVIGLLIAEGPNAKLKKAVICEAASIKLGKEPTPVAYQKVMQELCVYQGSTWSLKPLAHI